MKLWVARDTKYYIGYRLFTINEPIFKYDYRWCIPNVGGAVSILGKIDYESLFPKEYHLEPGEIIELEISKPL